MGDTFNNIGAGAIVVNRSVVESALNAVSKSNLQSGSTALQDITNTVEASGNSVAVKRLQEFLEQVAKPKPEKSFLRYLWQDIVSLVPAVAQLPAAIVFIKSLLA